MEKITRPEGTERIKGHSSDNLTLNNIQADVQKARSLDKRLSTGYRIYWEYLEWLGLSGDPNLIILSPTQHYYYDVEDMKDVTTVLNLKQLNYIKEIREFLRTMNHMLPERTFFVGSFIDRRHQYGFFPGHTYPDYNYQGVDPVENGISSRIPLLNLIYDFLDSRTNNRNMTRKSVTAILEEAGFKILDMTEINGITCFCAQKS